MRKRITCITIFDEESLYKINSILQTLNKYKLCKVPYLKEPYTLEDRKAADTLPYHFTLSYWDESEKEKALEIFNTINIQTIEIVIKEIIIKKGNADTYNMYFSFDPTDRLKEVQRYLYEKTKNEKFNPNTYLPHISIHSDENYQKLIEMKNILMKDFEEFTISFSSLGLFEIYPAKRIA